MLMIWKNSINSFLKTSTALLGLMNSGIRCQNYKIMDILLLFLMTGIVALDNFYKRINAYKETINLTSRKDD